MRICTPTMEELNRVLQRVIVLAFLGQNKGRVRFLWVVGAHACRGRGREGPERRYSTLLLRRFKLRFLLLPSSTEQEVGICALGG
jgi:hypothetical protein